MLTVYHTYEILGYLSTDLYYTFDKISTERYFNRENKILNGLEKR
jgi:hypothetical protein